MIGRMTPGSRTVPAWLAALKVLLAALLVVGALAPSVGGFAGKGMAFRLPLFLAPGLLVTLGWWRHRTRPYPVALDVAFTVPFLLDTLANAVGAFDAWARTDDVLHLVSWIVLTGGVTWAIAEHHPGRELRPLVWLAGTGFGAGTIVAWEIVEYAVMRSGVGGLQLSYADTVMDLGLSSTGGAVGAFAALVVFARTGRPVIVRG
jgi:hypothetical protein